MSLHGEGLGRHAPTGLASLDWTKSLARRETRWRWASFNGHGRVTVLRVAQNVVDGKTVEQAQEGAARVAAWACAPPARPPPP